MKLTRSAAVTLMAIAAGCAAPEGGAKGAGANKPAQPAAAVPAKPLKPAERQQALAEAYAAFERKQLDAALAGADRVLAGNHDGPGAAEAQYLRGRVFEERATLASAANDVPAAKAALQAARDAYNASLVAKPAPSVEGNARAGIANVAYFQEDYATAIAQWSAAFEKIPEPATKSWVLYRIGLSQQRFGNFTEADRTFQAVQTQFPNTEPAKRAAAHQGARGFHVQVGVFGTPTNADAALAALRADGVIGMRLTDAAGRNVVRVGPAPTYEHAKALKARLAGKYPDAMIIP
jgi:tetratricopeptide (TPR) repeat protein